MSDYIKLSTSDVPTFSGDEKDYPDWVRCFRTMLGFEESALLRDTALDEHVPISVQQTKLEELLTREQEIEDKAITAEYTKAAKEEELKQMHKQQEKLRASIAARLRLQEQLRQRLKAKMESNPIFAEFSAQHDFDAFIWDFRKSALDNNAEFKRLAGKVNAQKEVLTATALKHVYIKVVPTAYKLPISEKIINSDVTLDDAMERVRKLETAAAMIGASPGQDASMGVGAATTPMDIDEGARAASDGESVNCKYCLNDGHYHWDCKRLTHDKKMYGITLFPSSHRMKRAAELLKSHIDEVERKEKERVIKDNNKGKNNKLETLVGRSLTVADGRSIAVTAVGEVVVPVRCRHDVAPKYTGTSYTTHLDSECVGGRWLPSGV
ncbi:unnamed protein product [Vitrella brassicaformis CCMP3155]|uniref:Uncharacterized protein n=1 Tax=Vitrella brassicaformis (strain CCMP3155) TaxID=1169540 RepID=A0A0G4EP74_VITBC|nr:unnamed protein product [Vitrella brassicaformis CCMP3155]|eukprot:CEL99229.1 unnamed protein product [Vitrella brassicaformis CCMP3155]